MPTNPDWISTTQLATELGVTAKFLREKREELFKPGKHYRLKNPNAYRPSYTWNPQTCKALLDKRTKEAAAMDSSQSATKAGRGTQLPFIPEVKPYEID